MIIPFTVETISEIIKCNSSMETGIFISLLANEYIKHHKITEEDFFKSLKNSLDKLNKNSKKDEN